MPLFSMPDACLLGHLARVRDRLSAEGERALVGHLRAPDARRIAQVLLHPHDPSSASAAEHRAAAQLCALADKAEVHR